MPRAISMYGATALPTPLQSVGGVWWNPFSSIPRSLSPLADVTGGGDRGGEGTADALPRAVALHGQVGDPTYVRRFGHRVVHALLQAMSSIYRMFQGLYGAVYDSRRGLDSARWGIGCRHGHLRQTLRQRVWDLRR